MRNAHRTLWVRPSKLLWLPALGAAIGAVWMFGTPHVLWTYHYTGSMGDKYYLDCDYLGRDSQRFIPSDGKCPFIMLLKPVVGRQ